MRKDIAFIMRELAKYARDEAVVLHPEPFKVLIATLLSQRTKDANTERAVERLFSQYKGPKELANAPLKDVQKLVKGAGFFRVKAKRIKEISRILLEKHKGRVPSSREELMGLPGVGAKTSACTLAYAFKRSEICVDTHVHRISNRLGLVDTKAPEETEAALRGVVPRRYWLGLNHSMVRFGQQVCLPIRPKHGQCSLREQCDFFNKKEKWRDS